MEKVAVCSQTIEYDANKRKINRKIFGFLFIKVESEKQPRIDRQTRQINNEFSIQNAIWKQYSV